MTVVAYRDGVMASDSRATSGKNYIETDKMPKMFRFSDGSIVGFAGEVLAWQEMARMFRESISKGDFTLPRLKRVTALFVSPKKTIFQFDGNNWERLTKRIYPHQYYSIGSGATIAMSAMDAGASAVEAVRIAIRRDAYCGGKIRTLEI